MAYLISNALSFKLVPTNILVLILAIAICWTVLRTSKFAASFAVVVACVLVLGGVTPVGDWLMLPLQDRFPQWQTGPHAAPDGIIVLGGEAGERIVALADLSRRFPQARLFYSGPGERIFAAEELLKTFARLGGDPSRITMEARSRNTFENAIYSLQLIKPGPEERWLLVTSALHMPRAIATFRHAGFRVEAYPVESNTGDSSHMSMPLDAGSTALSTLDIATREWTALVAYRLMGRTDSLFPAPYRQP
jgi:uncharacterized SAM-binding protein YcdF (DUF218 family)